MRGSGGWSFPQEKHFFLLPSSIDAKEAISFFQEGKPEVTHRTTRMPSSEGKTLAEATVKEEHEQPSSTLTLHLPSARFRIHARALSSSALAENCLVFPVWGIRPSRAPSPQ